MFDKRLFSLAPGVGRLVAAKVLCQWVGLLANIVFVFTLVHLLEYLLFGTEITVLSGRIIGLADHFGSTGLPGEALAAYAIVIVFAMVIRFLMLRSAAYFGTEAAERVKLALRERLFNKMLALGPSYSQRVSTADVVQSAGEGIEQIQSFFELFLPQLFYAILAPITLFLFVAPINMPTAVTLLVCAPLIVLIVGLVAMRAARVFKQYWGKYTDMGSAFLDDLQGLETLKTFDADARAARRMDDKAEQFRVMTMNVLQIQLRSLTAMDVVAYGGAAAGIIVAVWQYMVGGSYPAGMYGWLPNFFRFANLDSLPLAGVLIVILLSADFFIPLRQLGSFFHVAMNGMTSTKRIFALLDAPEPARGTAELPACDDGVTVTLQDVTFRYAPLSNPAQSETAVRGAAEGDALQGISFTAAPGDLTAIVGPSGSGKSTVVELLAGSLTGYEGSITLADPLAVSPSAAAGMPDGHGGPTCELRDLTSESLTHNVTLVGANSHLFAGTLRENLLMARPGATDDDLWRALDAARIADFVQADPQGLDLRIDQGAANLSGGQRQRIAIARALLRGSAVYVFDEATSSVDVESETVILQTIRELADSGKTVIMVTHRMANAVDADQVVVFAHGATVETGTHAELMAANGTYAGLFRAQDDVERVGRREEPGYDAPVQSLRMSDSAEPAVQNGTRIPNSSDSAEPNMHEAAEPDLGAADRKPSDGGSMSDWQLVKRLLHEVGSLRKYMIIACTCGTLGHLAATFLPVFGVAAAFAAIGLPIWHMNLTAAIAAMIVCALIRGGMRYAEQYMNHNVAFRLLALFRSKAFAALRRLAPAKLAGKGKGDLIALVTTDVELLEIFFAHTISPVVIAVVTTVIYAIALLALSPIFAILLIVAHLVVGVALPKLFALAVRGLGSGIRKESAALDDEMLDDMRGLDEIIRFGQGGPRLAGIAARTRSLWSRRARLSARNGDFAGLGAVLVMLFTALAVFLAMVMPDFAVYAGSNAVMPIAVQLNVSQLIAAFVLIASSFGPTLALSALPASLTQTFASARRLFALMDEAPAVVETGTAHPEYHGMTVRDVTFGYGSTHSGAAAHAGDSEAPDLAPADCVPTDAPAADSTTPVLSHISLDVPEHGILGIQGPSGRGKSTLLKLLMRYWDPQSGAVELSGTPLPQVDVCWRRRVQTMMGQETYLFDGTIRENLVIALPQSVCADGSATAGPRNDADLDRTLRDALRKASVLELVDSLPQGLDTPVGELGGRLSEGERQRIGLARVFLRHADLVLFDEPTSRLDAYNESVILQSINGLAGQGSAVVLVSHRDSTMRIADGIVRM
ncbi:ABC transporter ATP-binding protein/permease [Bifidobacterium moukalabense]|uniref:ABC transporter ATP-binding protein/permease n=1 Tax=Bifidobacterium moukalabense TaxID=1333651 RepID=UPI0010F7B0F8|nr:ATP-binding cassette domain-containing protein [Bifidobacterium moukalabense]